jgi:ABC-type branched-subunit amino acid transport system substrate-binding protein
MALEDYSRKRQLRRPAASAPSEVWYALDPDGHPVVVKLLKSKLAADVQRFSHEAECAEKLISPNVAQVWESGMEPEPYIVFEYVDGKDLTGVAPIRNMWEYLRTAEAIAAGLAAIHEQGIAHRDIKPDNIRYERDGHAKIVDLGIALTNKEAVDRQTVVPPGTEGWMAPERRQEQLPKVVEEQKSDIFSTGLLLSCLCTGIHPFGHDQRRIEDSAEQPDLARIDEYLRDLLRKTLERDPTKRPEAKELLREIRRLARRVPASPRRGIGRIGGFARKFTRLHRKSIAIVAVSLLVVPVLLVYILAPGPIAAALGGVCPIGPWHNSGDAVLRFGALFSTSGPLAAQGPQQFAAVELALSDVRAAGGASGIQIVPLDGVNKVDEGDSVSDTACRSTVTLLDNGIDIIIGPSSSAVAHKIIDRITSAGTILFSPSNTAPEFTDYADKGLYFRTAASDTLQGRALGKVVSEDGNKNILIISRDDSYGNGLSREVERALRLSQVELLREVKYNPDTIDFDPLVKATMSSRTDTIVLIGFDETAKILAALRSAGITPQNRRIYGVEGNMRETLPGLVGSQGALNGMRGTTRSRINPDFIKRLNASVGGGLVEFTYAPEVYDAVIVSALAAASAESDNPMKIAKKINEVTEGGEKCATYAICIEKIRRGVDVDYDGVSGPLEFNDAGEPCMVSYSVVQFNEYGRLIIQKNIEASNFCVGPR